MHTFVKVVKTHDLAEGAMVAMTVGDTEVLLARVLDAMRYCHATTASARLAVRAMALQWNFHPYGPRPLSGA